MSRRKDKRTTISDEAKKLAALLMDTPDKAITDETKDKRTVINDAAEMLSALIIDSPDRTITDEILTLARYVYVITDDQRSRKSQLNIEYQHLLVDYIDSQMESLRCTSKEKAAAKLIAQKMFEDEDGRFPFRGYTPKSLVEVYNNLKKSGNLFPSKKV